MTDDKGKTLPEPPPGYKVSYTDDELYELLGKNLDYSLNHIKHTGEASRELLEQVQAAFSVLTPGLDSLEKAITEKMETQEFQDLLRLIRRISRVQTVRKTYQLMMDAGSPAIQEALKKELKKPQYGGKTLVQLFEDALNSSPIGESLQLFEQAVTEAQKAAIKEETPHATIKKADVIEYPLDKPNSIIWNLLEKDTEGQITFNMAKYGSRKEFLTYYAINFDGLGDSVTIDKRLLPFDKRVYIAVSALFNAGNNVITLPQIYYAMGYTGKPGAKDKTRINDAITKMTTARIYFDNKEEAEKYKYPHFKYDGSLLPIERGTFIVNGQISDAAIKIFREPPLITFAKQRKQITTIDVKLLQSPISKTDANLLIEDYLIERISKAKNGKGKSCRVLFKTLYAHVNIADKPTTNTEKQQRKRAPEKVKKYLTYYQQQGYITRFSMEKDGVTVHW